MRNRRDTAFTLIELLLVVAIISLLISILLPSLKFKIAKDTVCESNQKLIYTSTVYYTVDYSGRLPGGRSWVGGDWRNINSVRNGTLYTYMGKNEAAYICPVFVETPRSAWISDYGGNNYQTTPTIAFTYSLNEYAGNEWQGRAGVKTIKGAQQPDKLQMYSDENPWIVPGYSNHPINNGAMGIGGYGAAGGIVDCIGSYHQPPNGNLLDGSSYVAFFDGHVGLVHVSETKEVVTPYRYKF